MNWALFTLTFILGYITCKLLYFLRATRSSLILIKLAQVTSLSVLAKSMEDFYYAKIYRMEKMVESGESEHNITAFSYQLEEEVTYFKKKAIQGLIELHPKLFKQVVTFDDWSSAMKFLEEHREVVMEIMREI